MSNTSRPKSQTSASRPIDESPIKHKLLDFHGIKALAKEIGSKEDDRSNFTFQSPSRKGALTMLDSDTVQSKTPSLFQQQFNSRKSECSNYLDRVELYKQRVN